MSLEDEDHASPDEGSSAAANPPSCPACGASNEADARFCHACGAELAIPIGTATAGTARAKSRRGNAASADQDRARKSLARQEFARTRTIVASLRASYGVAALIVTVLVLVPSLLAWHPIGIATGGIALAIMVPGFVLIVRQPLLWSLVIAALWTVLVAVEYVFARGAGIGVGFAIEVFIAVAMWAGVTQAARLQRLMQENPELTLARHRVAPERRVAGGVAETARESRRRESRVKRLGRLKLAGMAVLLLAALITALVFAMRPESAEVPLERFTRNWSGAELAALVAQFDAGAVDPEKLESALARRVWRGTRPALGEARLEPHGPDEVLAAFPVEAGVTTEAGEVGVLLRLDGTAKRWRLVDLELPDLRVGDPEAAAAAFRSAWSADGLDALVALGNDGLQQRRASLERVLEKRDWLRARPAIAESGIGKPTRSGSVSIEFELEGDAGIVETGWEYWHPSWRMTRFKPPAER